MEVSRLQIYELNEKVEKLDLRYKQVLILLNAILKFSNKKTNTSASDIVAFMDTIIRANKEAMSEDVDLVSQLVDKELETKEQ